MEIRATAAKEVAQGMGTEETTVTRIKIHYSHRQPAPAHSLTNRTHYESLKSLHLSFVSEVLRGISPSCLESHPLLLCGSASPQHRQPDEMTFLARASAALFGFGFCPTRTLALGAKSHSCSTRYRRGKPEPGMVFPTIRKPAEDNRRQTTGTRCH